MQQLQEDYMQNQNRQQNKYSVNRILSCFSILLIMLCYLLISTILYSFIFDTTMQYHLVYSNTCFTIIILSLGIALGFNVMINYTFAIFVSPGTTNDYFIPRQNDTENSENQIENNANQNLRYLKFNYTIKLTQNIPSPSIVLDQSTLRFCNYCQLPKPQRSHHCSICNKCVLKMDHHCPWINNCVGHLNHRYFILFLTYIFFGTFYINLLNINIQFSTQFQEFKNQQSYLFSTIWIIDLGLFWTIACFGSWNWFLILRGYTVIEFSERNTKTTYEKGEIKDNLKQVFGDFKYIFEIFMPNFKKLPSNGVIWNQIDKNLEKINMSVD